MHHSYSGGVGPPSQAEREASHFFLWKAFPLGGGEAKAETEALKTLFLFFSIEVGPGGGGGLTFLPYDKRSTETQRSISETQTCCFLSNIPLSRCDSAWKNMNRTF